MFAGSFLNGNFLSIMTTFLLPFHKNQIWGSARLILPHVFTITSPILQFHSGYQASDLAPVVRKLHSMLLAPTDDKLKTIRNKYSHKVFFEVASLPLVDIDILEKALASP
ncbi:hypothetical protein ATANTOWER_025357 [Ataeniobius toweri]|uniref:Cyclin C-terminal domain-containing protein n=1 Tax=Ataeniobius toweri TaxID=208326 RepID=A0ABU7AZI1_9TELE|nr:hypothetical protein [Ataeniobius toweri]